MVRARRACAATVVVVLVVVMRARATRAGDVAVDAVTTLARALGADETLALLDYCTDPAHILLY
jgi:hypothetical protein|tara:strand:+ start:243 stop:434 length:192 start_codon:yes stop_codon:yes gene_type:complete